MQRKSKVKRYNWDFHLETFKVFFLKHSQLQPGSEKIPYSHTDIVALSSNYFTKAIFLNQGVETQKKRHCPTCATIFQWDGVEQMGERFSPNNELLFSEL